MYKSNKGRHSHTEHPTVDTTYICILCIYTLPLVGGETCMGQERQLYSATSFLYNFFLNLTEIEILRILCLAPRTFDWEKTFIFRVFIEYINGYSQKNPREDF